MKAIGAKIREIDVKFNRKTGETELITVIYYSGIVRQYLPGKFPDRIAAFMKWSKVKKIHDNIILYY